MSYVSVKVDIDGALKKFEMTADEGKKAVIRALNKTAKSVQIQASREIRDAGYNVKSATIKKAIKVRLANNNVLQAGVRALGRPIPLIDYGARQTKKGVSVNVKDGRKLISGAFIATMPTGHKGVFLRKKGTITGKRGKTILARVISHELFGPSIPAAFSNDVVKRAMLNEIRDTMPKKLEQELNYLKSKTK